MLAQFHLNSSINALETIIVKADGGPLRGKSYIYRKPWEDLRELLIIKDIEELSELNIGDTANKHRYISILKFKGLEKRMSIWSFPRLQKSTNISYLLALFERCLISKLM